MKNLKTTTILLLLTAACTAKQPPAPVTAQAAEAPVPAHARRRPGSIPIASRGRSCGSAIPIDAPTAEEKERLERQWVADNYPGANGVAVQRMTCEGKTLDEVKFTTANGFASTLYFDAGGK